MNKQGIIKDGKWSGGIEWTRLWHKLHGFTSNPIKGCEHECRWEMPDGTVARCYAEATVEKFPSANPGGFKNLRFDEDELRAIEKHNEPAGIFFGSMTDWMGKHVDDEWIVKSLQTMERCPQHYFLTLTKNAPRLLKFMPFPEHVWIGGSSAPTFMFGGRLTTEQQRSFVFKQLDVFRQLKLAGQAICWMSIEPLSMDIVAVFEEWLSVNGGLMPLDWAVLGAASNGPKYFQPDPKKVESAHRFLRDERGIPIFHKGNLKWEPHLEEFPACVQELKQDQLI